MASGSKALLLERPLTARSVIASLLLGRHPPSASSALLVRWCALFGISESSARVALTRMARAGELRSDGGTYELAGRVGTRQAEQDFALSPPAGEWNGTWTLAVVRTASRPAAERVELRREMAHRRMAALRDGVWVRPDNLPHRVDEPSCTWFSQARPEPIHERELVDLFDLDAIEQRSRRLLPLLTAATRRLPGESELADAFVVGAAVAQHLRRDPLLPPELLPRTWRADELRAAYATYSRAFGAAVRDWSKDRR